MKKTIYGMAIFIVTSAICLFVVNLARAEEISCALTQINNTNAILDETEQESCGECIWFTITAGWAPGDPASLKWQRNRARAYGTVQKCKFKQGQQYQCISALLTGEVDCPDDDPDPEAPGGEK